MQLAAALITAPTVPLLTTAEAKSHLRVDHSVDDGLIDAYVAAATSLLDGPNGILRTSLVAQAWADTWSAFPPIDRLRLTCEPLLEVTSVEYVPAGGTSLVALAADQWTTYTDALGCWVKLVDGAAWPDTATRPSAVVVTYTAGFGHSSSDVPANVIHAVKLLVGHFYENREAAGADTLVALPFAVDALLAPWKRIPG
jgi:uncharacterized phiE125 gp8 family phage protein